VARTSKYEEYGLCGAFIEIPAGLTLAIRMALRMFTRYADATSNRMGLKSKRRELCTISPVLLIFVALKMDVAIQT
jgi:hypothetical protein